TFTRYTPAGVLLRVVSVNVVLPSAVIVDEEKLAVVPVGRPEQLNLIGCAPYATAVVSVTGAVTAVPAFAGAVAVVSAISNQVIATGFPAVLLDASEVVLHRQRIPQVAHVPLEVCAREREALGHLRFHPRHRSGVLPATGEFESAGIRGEAMPEDQLGKTAG